jgi:hypothetical protein
MFKKASTWFKKTFSDLDKEEEKVPQVKPAEVKKDNVKHKWDLIIDDMPANEKQKMELINKYVKEIYKKVAEANRLFDDKTPRTYN